ncbi:MAG: hypothetical protein ACOYL6_00360 [Bacteriovoracaceae bacterium]
MKYLYSIILTLSFGAMAAEQEVGIKVPSVKLDDGSSFVIEQYLKKIKAYDAKENFKLDFFCLKNKNKSNLKSALECKLINID